MTPGTAEEERFKDFFDKFRWRVVHEPKGQRVWLIIQINQLDVGDIMYELHLPAHWHDDVRIRTTAWFIVRHVLDKLHYTPPHRLTELQAEEAVDDALIWKIADSLIVPQPLLDAHIAQYGARIHSLRALARSLGVPVQSVYSVLNMQPNATADQVHHYIRMVMGSPWFLPPNWRGQDPQEQE